VSGMDFSGKNVLVTGANRGIGIGVAEGFIEAGANTTILAIDDDTIDVAERLSGRYGRTVNGVQCDITKRDDVEAAINDMDRIDILINNAGLELITPIEEVGREVEATFCRIIEINVIGTYYVTREVLPRMPDGGKIVMTSSMWGKTAVGEFSAYCASKHANIGFMRSLAQELAARKISVNAVCPGWVRTVGSMRSLSAMAKRQDRSEEAVMADIMSAQALDGLMEPKDMAAMYMFLASDAAVNITGQAYTVDRGELMQ
jgi:NAD(P)-dependent dehydrogenase (short-subunit alcohol dehydrogenase family)